MVSLSLLLAEVVDDGLEDEDRSGAAKDSERLAREETVDDSDNEAGDERLHAGHVVPGGVSKEPPECYDGGQTGEVDEEVRGDALEREGILEVRQVPQSLPLDVVPQTPEEPSSPDEAGLLSQLRLLFLLIYWVRSLVWMFSPLL